MADSKQRRQEHKKSDEEVTPKDMTDNDDEAGDWSESANRALN